MYKRSSGGMLCCNCEMCDVSSYSRPGGEGYKKRMATIKAPASADHTQESDPAPAPAAAAPSQKTNSVFSLGDL